MPIPTTLTPTTTKVVNSSNRHQAVPEASPGFDGIPVRCRTHRASRATSSLVTPKSRSISEYETAGSIRISRGLSTMRWTEPHTKGASRVDPCSLRCRRYRTGWSHELDLGDGVGGEGDVAGDRPDPGPASAGKVPVAPRPGVMRLTSGRSGGGSGPSCTLRVTDPTSSPFAASALCSHLGACRTQLAWRPAVSRETGASE